MRFGVIKTLIENKLIESFIDKRLSTDLSYFQNKILSDKSFSKHMIAYDTLSENKSLDPETANYLINDVLVDLKESKISDETFNRIVRWTSNVVKENRYSQIDDLIYGDVLHPEKKSIARKNIVESLGKNPIIKESKSTVPIKSMLKIANSTVNKKLENLSESDREKIIKIMKSDEEAKLEFNKLKESTINKLDNLISESDDELKNTLTETKNKLSNSEYSRKELIKLMNLSEGLS